jgi:sarcosine oxidase subunit beta
MTAMRMTDIVVIGAGCIGLASAIALAARGAKVTLVERSLPGSASSTRHGGGIRQQFGTALNVRLSQLSANTWDDFAGRFGVDPLFRRIGYLFLARTAREASALAEHVRLQNGLGVDSEYLDTDEITRRWPVMSGRGFVGAGFRAQDGWINQHRVIDGFVAGAKEAGVDLLVGTEATTLEVIGGRVAGVATTGGPISADSVLIATGAWVAMLFAPLGITVPVEGRRHELLIVEPAEPLPPGLPWLIAVEDAVHIRSDVDGRAQVGGFLGEDRAVDPDRYELRADDAWTRAVLQTASAVFGVVDPDVRVHRGWAGLYPTTPDRHPIIDRLADGLFVALGFAGTGMMHAPAAGLLSAELVLDGTIRSVDGSGLTVSRFDRESASTETTAF